MIQVAFARGNNAKIRSASYEDGKIYISKDSFKIYTDYNNQRAELNPGIITSFTLNWAENVQSMTYNFSNLDIKLSASNTLVFVMAADDNYSEQEVYCSGANGNVLTFERSGIEAISTSGKIFAYDAVGGNRSFKPQNGEEEQINEKQIILDESWELDENGNYTNEVLSDNIQENIIMSTDTTNIISAEANVGQLIVRANDIPKNNVIINLKNIPETAKLDTINLLSTNWINNTYTYPISEIKQDSVLAIQFSEAVNITAQIEEGQIIFIANDNIIKNIQADIFILDSLITKTIITLSKNAWVIEPGLGYKNSIILNSNLHCGSEGNTSPLINATTNSDEFNYLSNVLISEDKMTLVFYATNAPVNDIEVEIIDFN